MTVLTRRTEKIHGIMRINRYICVIFIHGSLLRVHYHFVVFATRVTSCGVCVCVKENVRYVCLFVSLACVYLIQNSLHVVRQFCCGLLAYPVHRADGDR